MIHRSALTVLTFQVISSSPRQSSHQFATKPSLNFKSAVSMTPTRFLLALLASLRGLPVRFSATSVLALALAGVAVLVALRRPRRVAGGPSTPAGGRRGRGLAGVRRVTIGADVRGCDCGGPIFERADGGGRLSVPAAAVGYLKRFAKIAELYFIVWVDSDGGEGEVRNALREAGVFSAGMDERKVVFCETEGGRVSVVRQLEPQLHIDGREGVVVALQRFIKYVAVVGEDVRAEGGATGANVLRYKGLDGFWGGQAAEAAVAEAASTGVQDRSR